MQTVKVVLKPKNKEKEQKLTLQSLRCQFFLWGSIWGLMMDIPLRRGGRPDECDSESCDKIFKKMRNMC